MSVAISLSERLSPAALARPWSSGQLPRAEGCVEVRFGRRGERTVLADLFQQGSAKARFPKVFNGGPPEAILINLAGGITGADRFQQKVHVDDGAHGIATTQAAEKIYRAGDDDQPALLTNELSVGADAFGEWLPQETIFFDGARLRRRFGIRLHETARLLACEAIVFGRTAMGETVQSGHLDDSWRVHLGDRLVFADGFRFDGKIQDHLDRPAIADGGRGLATVLYVGLDSEALIQPAMRALAPFRSPGKRAAVSRIGELIIARFAASDGRALRDMLKTYLPVMRRVAGSLPKLWHC